MVSRVTRATGPTLLSAASRVDPAMRGKKSVATACGKKNTISAIDTAML